MTGAPKIGRDKTPDEALASLMRLCAKGERCSGDARRLMYRWGVPAGDQPKILDTLIAQKFIDDGRYAVAYVREKVRFSGWGAHKIRAALSGKGIAREIIERALEGLDSEVMDTRLEKSLARKAERLNPTTPYELRTKLIRYGLSLGYDYDKVSEAVKKQL
ncbi:MAG: RecX family transcriptional regulator [Rikenellaceae bacterium]|jgi:regulatory protein|nr:RecX family transcriptional regulator [Rikenellaceae bacterium]